jgi:hypothetical protein
MSGLSAGRGTRACTYVCGLLMREGRDWERAFEHISDHFKRAAPGKPVHSIFRSEYRNEAAIRDLLFTTANRPGRVMGTKLTDDGTPAVRIERGFKKQLGMESGETWLLVIVAFSDRREELVTAYPITPPSNL